MKGEKEMEQRTRVSTSTPAKHSAAANAATTTTKPDVVVPFRGRYQKQLAMMLSWC